MCENNATYVDYRQRFSSGVNTVTRSAMRLFACAGVLSTGLLHVAGITVGWATDFPRGTLILRAAGAATAVVGATYLLKEIHFFA